MLVVRAGSRQADVVSSFPPELEQVVVEELAAVVRMDLPHTEGQLGQDVAEGILHDQPAAAQHRTAFTPAGGHVYHLEGMHILAGGVGARVVDQVDLEVAS
jgi:hypothetical protein